jgi:hypothetical protein
MVVIDTRHDRHGELFDIQADSEAFLCGPDPRPLPGES